MTLTPDQAWQSILLQLQMEMPKASFDTWVRNTSVVGFDDDVLRIGAINTYARDWLESRLTSTVSQLLIGIFNKNINVEFVVDQQDREDIPETSPEAAEEQAEVTVVNRLQYDEVVTPSKVVAIPGYFSRLIPEIGPRNAWLYVGWRQAFWSGARGIKNGSYTHRVALKHVIRFCGLSRRTFFRAIESEACWENLSGLVDRDDTSPRWAQGHDHRAHRLPNRYTVHMTLRLSRTDSVAIFEWLNEHVQNGLSLLEAIQLALQVKDLVGELLPPLGFSGPNNTAPQSCFQTVMDMATAIQGDVAPDVQAAAESLHRKIINGFGTILLTHYFLETVIPQSGLTPAQAWLVALLRDRCYVNAQSGEVRDEVVVRGGYAELASWLGLSRPKTVWEWIRDPAGLVSAFTAIVPRHENDEFDTLRVKIRMEEPIFVNGAPDTIRQTQGAPVNGEVDTDKQGATGTHAETRLTPMEGGNGTRAWREWHSVKHLTTVSNTTDLSTSTTQTRAAVVPSAWVLRKLLIQNHVHPKVTKELLTANASAQALVSWVLFACSPAGEGIDDPVAYAIASLREDKSLGAGGVFDRLAAKHPSALVQLLKSAPKDRFSSVSSAIEDPDWNAAMGLYNPKVNKLQKILVGE